MQLSVARLCLDCQEIHEEDRCPVCTSDAFAFMTRWVTLDETPSQVPSHENRAGRSSKIDSYRRILNPQPQRSVTARWLRKGGIVVAAGLLARWGWNIAAHHTRPPQRDSPDPR